MLLFLHLLQRQEFMTISKAAKNFFSLSLPGKSSYSVKQLLQYKNLLNIVQEIENSPNVYKKHLPMMQIPFPSLAGQTVIVS